VGKLITLPFPARRSHWHDSAPRVPARVPPPPGSDRRSELLAGAGHGLAGGQGGGAGGGGDQLYFAGRCRPLILSCPAVNNA
jgi:hypothetical protein